MSHAPRDLNKETTTHSSRIKRVWNRREELGLGQHFHSACTVEFNFVKEELFSSHFTQTKFWVLPTVEPMTHDLLGCSKLHRETRKKRSSTYHCKTLLNTAGHIAEWCWFNFFFALSRVNSNVELFWSPRLASYNNVVFNSVQQCWMHIFIISVSNGLKGWRLGQCCLYLSLQYIDLCSSVLALSETRSNKLHCTNTD